MKGKFYSVGLGPGDRELLTYKAVRVMEECSIIAVPVSGSKRNVAMEIAGDIVKDKDVLYLDMPMTKDKDVLALNHNLAIEKLTKCLEEGKSVAFLTLGDPSIYSSTMYVHHSISDKGFETYIVPGITSFSAAAAALNTSLCEGGEALHIIPSSYVNLDMAVSLEGNKVFMKSGKSIVSVKEAINKKSGHMAMMVEQASMKEEKIYKNLDDVDENSSYFSLIIAKEA
ncbi:MAG: precorrin-2 C(20)-methyltransferase [Filifactoraceae bacterium]